VASATLYALMWQFEWNIPAYPHGEWVFNPFAWQLLFVFGAWISQANDQFNGSHDRGPSFGVVGNIARPQCGESGRQELTYPEINFALSPAFSLRSGPRCFLKLRQYRVNYSAAPSSASGATRGA
jgi:hypothetical protein